MLLGMRGFNKQYKQLNIASAGEKFSGRSRAGNCVGHVARWCLLEEGFEQGIAGQVLRLIPTLR